MNNDNSNFNFNMKDLESLLPSNLIPDVVNENNLWHQKINANSNLNNRFDSDVIILLISLELQLQFGF